MRSDGAIAAICAKGTATISAGRAASSSCVTRMVASAAPAEDAPTQSAASAEMANFMVPPPVSAGMFCRAGIVPYSRGARLAYGTWIVGSTTAQKAHLGRLAVSNNSGRLVRVTGNELSQV